MREQGARSKLNGRLDAILRLLEFRCANRIVHNLQLDSGQGQREFILLCGV